MSKFINDFTGGFKEGFKENIGDGFKFDAASLGKSIGQNANSIVSGVSGVVGNAIGGGYESGVGNVMGTLGSVASVIPGPYGMAANAILNIGGGAINRIIGSKVDQAKLNAANEGTSYLSNFSSDASYFDDIKAPMAVAAIEDPYKGMGAKGKNADLRRKREAATQFAYRQVENNLGNITNEQMDNMMANYAAFGGPLDFGLFPVGGAIDYELAQRKLAQKDLEIQNKEKFAAGGTLHSNGTDWTNGITVIDNGGTHEQNPFEGVPMGIAEDGKPNLVEEGEVIYNDYVYSNRIKVPKAVRNKYKLRGQKELTFAGAAKKAQKESEERPNDPISQRGLKDIMQKLMIEQEIIREKRQNRKYAYGGAMGYHYDATGPLPNSLTFLPGVKPISWLNQTQEQPIVSTPSNTDESFKAYTSKQGIKTIGLPNPMRQSYNDVIIDYNQTNGSKTRDRDEDEKGSWLTGLRYVPAIGAGIGVFSDLMGWTNKPDYSSADSILRAASSIGNVNYTPIGDYMRYIPLDRLFYANQLGAQAGATRRSVINTSGGNRGAAMAGLLAADYNAQGQLGNLFRQAEEFNLGQREKVATFNRATNMFNAENALKAQIANRENAKIGVDAAAKAAAIRDAVDARVSAARSANLTNFLQSLGDIGREEVEYSWIDKNPAYLYGVSRRGKGVNYKGSSTEGAYGGPITIKNKRRRR